MFIVAAVVGFQVSFFGLALAFLMMPVMHSLGWNHRLSSLVRWLPFSLILAGLGLGSLSLFGLQPVLFGFGFHF